MPQVEAGTVITPFFDPLVCKLIVQGSTREETVSRLSEVLSETEIYGPPNNLSYLYRIVNSHTFIWGACNTAFLNSFQFTPHAVDILSGGLETTVQDYPGRLIGYGLPRSGPMDSLAFRAANLLVDNDIGTEGLEILVPAPQPKLKLYFHVSAVIAITGADAEVRVNGEVVETWARLIIPEGSKVEIKPVMSARIWKVDPVNPFSDGFVTERSQPR